MESFKQLTTALSYPAIDPTSASSSSFNSNNKIRIPSSTLPIMSTMPASHGHSQACCNVPPIVSKGYKAKGSYEEIGGYKTCTAPVPSAIAKPPLSCNSTR